MPRRHEAKSLDVVISEAAAWAVAGQATGGTRGALVGGIAPIAAAMLREAKGWIATRLLTDNESYRIGAIVEDLQDAIDLHVSNGDTLRTDGFFDDRANDRAFANEILEGVLVVAQRERQERKLPHLAELYATIAYNDWIDPETASRLLTVAEELTYTQLALIALVSRKDEFALPSDDKSTLPGSWRGDSTRQALLDLGFNRRELLLPERVEGVRLSVPIGVPGAQRVQPFAALLYGAMRLDRIPNEDLAEVAAGLWEYRDGPTAGAS